MLSLLANLAAVGALTTSPYPTGAYDAAAARTYYSGRPFKVASRAAEIGWKSASFAGSLLLDMANGDGLNGPRAEERGRTLTNLLTDLGPTFIKIGQSASVRTDLLPPAYVKALTELQENVPPFATAEAREIISSELGSRVLTGISAEPIAAASLGQVYRATCDGRPVAVKVQRPDIEQVIALDMHLVRDYAAPLATAVLGAPGDLAGIADAWGAGLVDELNYNKEAAK